MPHVQYQQTVVEQAATSSLAEFCFDNIRGTFLAVPVLKGYCIGAPHLWKLPHASSAHGDVGA